MEAKEAYTPSRPVHPNSAFYPSAWAEEPGANIRLALAAQMAAAVEISLGTTNSLNIDEIVERGIALADALIVKINKVAPPFVEMPDDPFLEQEDMLMLAHDVSIGAAVALSLAEVDITAVLELAPANDVRGWDSLPGINEKRNTDKGILVLYINEIQVLARRAEVSGYDHIKEQLHYALTANSKA